ncbi:MAG: sporulation peptidase YabG [Bacilli bacterium]|nr:sporulation peptidase YabG [Bacilli bacterium]
MEYKIGDMVTRESYSHDIVFKIIDIVDNNYILKGKYFRLYADSPVEDLKLYKKDKDAEEEEFSKRVREDNHLDRDEYFYLPGKILHIDGDKEYLERCLNYYKEFNLWAVGSCKKETEIAESMQELLEEYKPNIVVITGHDAYYKKKGGLHDLEAYKNSKCFVDAITEARKYEGSHEKLIIIAGACQSDYDELIKAGANFASSPKRINIHALDPAIIAKSISLAEITKDIDLKSIIEKTKYGKEGIGGIRTKGTMYVGYPR